MATFKKEFQDLAVELFIEFADMQQPFTVFKESDVYDPRTSESGDSESYDLQAIPIDISLAERVFANATNDSIFLVALKNGSTTKLDASYQSTLDGAGYAIEAVENDAADASWFFRLAR